MKRGVRVLGFDDGPFTWDDVGRPVPVVGVLTREGGYVEAVLRTEVTVDGDDATERLLELLEGSRYREQAQYLMLDGVAFGGFNVLNVKRLAALTGLPVLTFTRQEPDLDAMREALYKHHATDADLKWALIRQTGLEPVTPGGSGPWIHREGLSREDALALLARTTVRGQVPEPLRLAHLIASALVRGESSGL